MTKEPKNPKPIHKQTKAFLDMTIAEPTKSLTDAYIETKDTKTDLSERRSIGSSASRLYNSPSAQVYLKKHRDLAIKTKLELLDHARRERKNLGFSRLANDISEQILDRTDGKAIQQVKTENTNLNVNIEASQELSADFTAFLKQKSQI